MLFLALATRVSATALHVSPAGSDDAVGTRDEPFRTVTRAAREAKAGDSILFQEGRYSFPQQTDGLSGTAKAPITITAAPGAKVVFDGTDELAGAWKRVTPGTPEGRLIQPAQWKRIGDDLLYAMKLKADISALIYDEQLMSDARWPDARWDDPWRLDRYMVLRKAGPGSKPGEIHDSLATENTLEESSKWIHYDRRQLAHREEMLADTGLDFTGASVLLSCFWTSFGTRVTQHTAGRNRFGFDTTFNGSGSLQKEAVGYVINRVNWDYAGLFKRSCHGGVHFFLMGLPALDIPKEWFYHQPSKTLYFIAPDGRKPQSGKARGKRRDYGITIANSSHVHLAGCEFIGTAVRMEDCTDSRIEDCTFRFSAYNKFVLGNYDMPATTEIRNARGRKNANRLYGNALVNCRFEYLDGNAFKGDSAGLTVDNVLVRQTQMTTLGNDSRSASFDNPLLVRRMTISDVGASVGIKGGGIDSVYELNNIMRFGGLQYDGAALQMGGRNKVIYRYNWSHDHPKRSYRFDAPSYPAFANAFGEMSYNVAWNTPGGFAVKGDDHLIHNNILLGNGAIELFNMKRWASKNERTLVANNLVPVLSAGTHDWDRPIVRKTFKSSGPETLNEYWLEETPVPATHPVSIGTQGAVFDEGTRKGGRKSPLLAVQKNNCHQPAQSVLRDPANLDFRPRPNSKLVDGGHRITRRDVAWKDGPLTGSTHWSGEAPDIGAYEHGASHYWIPGFKFPHASTPIPPDSTVTAKANCDLMWLGGYKADRHKLYFGRSPAPEFRKELEGNANVFDPGVLKPGQTYYWRVDAIRDGETLRGKTWTFAVKE
jgi:hypothetical protein